MSTAAAAAARRAVPVAGLGAFVVLLVGGFGLPCPVASALHYPCPGCGMTRAMRALFRGDVADAMRLHPVAPFLFAVALPVVVTLAAGHVLHGDANHYLGGRLGRYADRALLTIMSALVIVWVARGAGALGGPVPIQ